MTSAGQGSVNDWRRLASASSVVDLVAAHVEGLAQLRAEDLPAWLTGLGVPAGWCIARFDNRGVQPSRIAVCGQHPGGGWEACETITVFGFTGMPPVDEVLDSADCTLRDLDAEAIATHFLATPPTNEAVAVRSSGYFRTAGKQVWAQYSTYVAGSDASGQGRLIQHSVFVESGCRAKLSDDIANLSNAIHHAYLSDVRARGH